MAISTVADQRHIGAGHWIGRGQRIALWIFSHVVQIPIASTPGDAIRHLAIGYSARVALVVGDVASANQVGPASALLNSLIHPPSQTLPAKLPHPYRTACVVPPA